MDQQTIIQEQIVVSKNVSGGVKLLTYVDERVFTNLVMMNEISSPCSEF